MTAWTDALAVARDEGYSGMPVRGSDLHARALEIMRGGFFLDDDDDDTDDDTDDEDMLAVDADDTPGDKALNLISQRYESDSDSDDTESTVSSDYDSDSDSTTISTLSSTSSTFQRTMDAQINNTMPIQVDDKKELRQWVSTLPLAKRKAFLDRYGSAFIQTADDAKAIFAIMDIDKGYQRLTQIDPFSQPIMKSGPL